MSNSRRDSIINDDFYYEKGLAYYKNKLLEIGYNSEVKPANHKINNAFDAHKDNAQFHLSCENYENALSAFNNIIRYKYQIKIGRLRDDLQRNLFIAIGKSYHFVELEQLKKSQLIIEIDSSENNIISSPKNNDTNEIDFAAFNPDESSNNNSVIPVTCQSESSTVESSTEIETELKHEENYLLQTKDLHAYPTLDNSKKPEHLNSEESYCESYEKTTHECIDDEESTFDFIDTEDGTETRIIYHNIVSLAKPDVAVSKTISCEKTIEPQNEIPPEITPPSLQITRDDFYLKKYKRSLTFFAKEASNDSDTIENHQNLGEIVEPEPGFGPKNKSGKKTIPAKDKKSVRTPSNTRKKRVMDDDPDYVPYPSKRKRNVR